MNFTNSISTGDIIKVSLYLGTSIVELVPYFIILWVIFNDKKSYDSPVYLIIFHLGIADCIQLVLHCSAVPFTVLQTPYNSLTIKVFGAFLNGIYHAMIPLTLLLAFNRFITLCFGPSTTKWFDKKLMKPCICFSWIWSSGAIAIFLSPLTSIRYDYKTLSWGYTTDDLFAYGSAVELAVTAFQNILGAIFYVCTIVKLAVMKNQFRSNTDFKYELRLLIQAIIIGIFGCLNCAYWNFFYYYLDDSYSAFLGNWLWIIQNGMNSFLYLTMNERIRKSFLLFLRRKPNQIGFATVTQSSQPKGPKPNPTLPTMIRIIKN